MPKDRIIRIERPVTVRDGLGGEVTTWETLVETWAEKIGATGAERFSPGANITVANRSATWRVAFDRRLNERMRLVSADGLIWGIIGLAVVGFNRDHDLITQSSGKLLP